MGIDGIGPKILNSCALALHEPSSIYFSHSLSALLPAQLCIHLITQLHKSGDNMVFLVCVISKVFERIVYSYIQSL